VESMCIYYMILLCVIVQLYREFDFDNADTSGFVTFDASNENAYWIDSNGRDLGMFM
jgi:hypothetical protein